MKTLFFKPLLITWLSFAIFSCKNDDDEVVVPDEVIIETPSSPIPDEFVGTWYIDHNEGPLSTNWEKGTFQGEEGFREFRTMILTKDGKNAYEYTSEVINHTDEVKQYFYQMKGTLTYGGSPASLTFYAQSGKMRIYSTKYSGYKESDIIKSDIERYSTILVNPEATTYSSSTNFLNAKRIDGNMQHTARFIKAEGNSGNPGGGENPSDPYSTPPQTGTYVQVGSQYYPTVTIENHEWMSVNYAGNGGKKDASKPEFGTFIKYIDLSSITIPEGWRIPSKEDYIKLLESQGIEYDEVWETTDGSDYESKKLLGQLMATTGWSKQDGLANNKSGFNAVPANLRVTEGNPHGEGSNCLLWTSDLDAEGNPVIFKIIQLPSDTFASFGPSIIGFNPAHIPLRLVRDK